MKRISFSERLRQGLELKNMKPAELSRLTNISKSSISHYLKGDWEGKQDAVYRIAHALGVSEAWLMGFDVPREKQTKDDILQYENVIPLPKTKKIPLIGTIACGEPITAIENIECDVEMPEHIRADFALRCKGDSMTEAHIFDGDIVYIREQPIVDNGEIAAVLIDDEATLKRFYQRGDTVTLMPCNSKYSPFVYTGEQLEDIRILGKAVGFTSTKI